MALLDFIYNRPNRVLALQKQYQADHRPIYLRPAGAKQTLSEPSSSHSIVQCSSRIVSAVVYGALFSVGMASTVYGIGCLVTGYGKPSAKEA
ncbi:hypothetical protein DFH08DRAFT_36523 [Mycena albidolilacea]|uniref:Uncharacterized protein n=1 Tax=Mycena albidolilacea TaxID=1033008 RepID=A0AAD7AW79_9AGAR|nr:hypothetical protein DFH08DRAFT_36523 [Mycena albidolilacea]